MNKEHILKKNIDFQRIIRNNRPYRFKEYILYVEKNNDSSYHFGFSVGKKIGKAVIRNKIKWQLKHIISKKDYQNGFNCIIIVNNNILNKSFKEMQYDLNVILEKLNLIKEKRDDKN